jgi:hypothetical protein
MSNIASNVELHTVLTRHFDNMACY